MNRILEIPASFGTHLGQHAQTLATYDGPLGSPEPAYTIILPATSEPAKVAADAASHFRLVEALESGPPLPLRTCIHTCALDDEVQPLRWLALELQRLQHEFVDVNVGTAEVLTCCTEHDVRWVCRHRVLDRSGVLWWVEARVPAELDAALANELSALAVATFELTPGEHVPRRMRWPIADQPPVHVDLPSNWRPIDGHAVASVGASCFRHRDLDDRAAVLFIFVAQRLTDERRLLRATYDQLARCGYTIGGAPLVGVPDAGERKLHSLRSRASSADGNHSFVAIASTTGTFGAVSAVLFDDVALDDRWAAIVESACGVAAQTVLLKS